MVVLEGNLRFYFTNMLLGNIDHMCSKDYVVEEKASVCLSTGQYGDVKWTIKYKWKL